jgi:uncharacterized protein (TIGR02118 family)
VGEPASKDLTVVKLVLLFKKREDLTAEQFLGHWQQVHIPLVTKIPNIRRYVISPVIGTPGGGSGPRDYDGMAELWFDSEEAARVALDTPETIATGLDGRNFIMKGSLRRFLCIETEVPI